MREKVLLMWTGAKTEQKWNIGLLRNVPAEARAVWLSKVTVTDLRQFCDEIDAVIWSLSAVDVVRLSEEERATYLCEAMAIEDALELEEMRRLVARAQYSVRGIALWQEIQQREDGEESQ
jgi:hypothetical protein